MIDTNAIFNINTESEFDKLALNIFKLQFDTNPVYRSFCDLLCVHPGSINNSHQIPFLPIQFFKTHTVVITGNAIQKTFISSGTTGQKTSKHHISDLSIYEQSFRAAFEMFYGPIKNYTLLALLPSYLERADSSLIYMVNDLIERSGHSESGFYISDHVALAETLNRLDSEGQKTMLIGVSFALLDLLETTQFKLKHTIIMETGGMKGRREELIRKDLHDTLRSGFGVPEIHSEYGMTELLSQAYSSGNGLFKTPPWMKVMIRDTEDALELLPAGRTGGINIIDLANINSCAFIATQDLGKIYTNGTFEILGRFDQSDVRGCNLMVL